MQSFIYFKLLVIVNKDEDKQRTKHTVIAVYLKQESQKALKTVCPSLGSGIALHAVLASAVAVVVGIVVVFG